MNFEWLKVGDQDACTRRICTLGPWLLEVVEDHWEYQKMMMACKAWYWNDNEQAYDEVATNIPYMDFHDNPMSAMEDWYGLNVLSERYFTNNGNGN